MLDPEITFLNHGSYGACPIPVFEDYQNWQKKLENQPVQFMTNFLWENLKKSREYLADYINCSESDILLFPNPTTAINNLLDQIIDSVSVIKALKNDRSVTNPTWMKKNGNIFTVFFM